MDQQDLCCGDARCHTRQLSLSRASPNLEGSPPTFTLTISTPGTFPYYRNRRVNAPLPQKRDLEQSSRATVASKNLPPSVLLTNPVNNFRFRALTNILL